MLIENNAKISKSPPSLNAAVWEYEAKEHVTKRQKNWESTASPRIDVIFPPSYRKKVGKHKMD